MHESPKQHQTLDKIRTGLAIALVATGCSQTAGTTRADASVDSVETRCPVLAVHLGETRRSIHQPDRSLSIVYPGTDTRLMVFFPNGCDSVSRHLVLNVVHAGRSASIPFTTDIRSRNDEWHWAVTPHNAIAFPDNPTRETPYYLSNVPLDTVIMNPVRENDAEDTRTTLTYSIIDGSRVTPGTSYVIKAGTDNGTATISPSNSTINRIDLASVQIQLQNGRNPRTVCVGFNTNDFNTSQLISEALYPFTVSTTCLYFDPVCPPNTVCGAAYGTRERCVSTSLCTALQPFQNTTLGLPAAVQDLIIAHPVVSELNIDFRATAKYGNPTYFGAARTSPSMPYFHTYQIQ